jgi:predicted Rdx family selenoprotein
LRAVTLKSGTAGRLEVTADGQLVFSKAKLGRHPRKGEVVELLTPHLGPKLNWR